MTPIGCPPLALQGQGGKLKISCHTHFNNFTYEDLCASWKLDRDEWPP
jgi:hypothetical protein